MGCLANALKCFEKRHWNDPYPDIVEDYTPLPGSQHDMTKPLSHYLM